MKTTEIKEPSADFYNFAIYKIDALENWTEEQKSEASIIVLLRNADRNELNLLAKIFQAVGKDLAKDAFVINQPEIITYKAINTAFNVKKLLVFGIEPKEIGLHLRINAYQATNFQGLELLFSHNLKTIAEDLAKKKQLWGQLQVMFK